MATELVLGLDIRENDTLVLENGDTVSVRDVLRNRKFITVITTDGRDITVHPKNTIARELAS